jgi:hypothetical protein
MSPEREKQAQELRLEIQKLKAESFTRMQKGMIYPRSTLVKKWGSLENFFLHVLSETSNKIVDKVTVFEEENLFNNVEITTNTSPPKSHKQWEKYK